MGISENECVLRQNRLEKLICENKKSIKQNLDLIVIPTITTEYQYKAYARLKRSQEYKETTRVVLKIFSGLTALGGFITVLAQVFSAA